MPVTYWLEHAWLDPQVASGVLVTADGGRITKVRTGTPAPPPGATALHGLTLPGLANAHSHAFHRALRGTAQAGRLEDGTRGTGPGHQAPTSFWTWREVMYATARSLTPDSYFALATAVYAEMALAGITCVGEFHYLHHQGDGTPYADPNAMGEALIAAAAEAGIRITLLDTAYLRGGLGPDGHLPLEGVQARFGDGTADRWYDRWSRLKGAAHARIGAAVHSVRAFAEEDGYATFAERTSGVPVHVHLSEQPAENEACLARYGRTPARLLADHGFWGPHTTAVHATHLTDTDIDLLGGAGSTVCMCPTTERDLADGIGPAPALQRAGSPLSLGSDSHAVIDLLEEARAMELDERLRTRARGHWTAAALLRAAGADGHACLGWPEAGRIRPGALADLTTIALDSVRTAGPPPGLAAETAVFAASAADVRHTVVGGRHVVADGRHRLVDDVPAALAAAIAATRG
ncbi:formimidoylglutamate deiminase [Actinacidiphila guanduensis]|uniref:Formiminoglutamate deiminase n=1 Tax=Actinacidiphila guanduensis TaxID=310781 RepID=A0A1H0EUY1_9ACTN|nr:formimidoylglutamate deiminase [Actinacidiphila guanduensis]SDN86191.1 formiminoglutamate deiminase [Actinacidiphila guanduensis]